MQMHAFAAHLRGPYEPSYLMFQWAFPLVFYVEPIKVFIFLAHSLIS
jgi:hypothetical protein